MAEIINILPLNPNNFEFQEYSSNDLNLIVSTEVETSFDPTTDYIEYYVFNLNVDIIESDLNLSSYQNTPEGLLINPEQDIQDIGFVEGTFNVLYHFFNPLLSSSIDTTYYISVANKI